MVEADADAKTMVMLASVTDALGLPMVNLNYQFSLLKAYSRSVIMFELIQVTKVTKRPIPLMHTRGGWAGG